MRKVIDLCLDLPPDAEFLTNTLTTFFCNPNYSGYKNSYAGPMAQQIGYTVAQLDTLAAQQGTDGFRATVAAAAAEKVAKPEEFVRYLDSIGVEWGITVDNGHNNQRTGEIVRQFPDKFKGFIFVDPNQGMAAVRELETSVKEYGLHALYLTAFRTRLPANDKKNYPLYAKCVELGIPVHIYSSLNLSTAVPYDIGHPRYIDEVARDFPELKIMAGVSGWPWVMDFLALPFRHKNVYVNFETHSPAKMAMPGSGYEPYLFYAENQLSERICFATNWGTQSLPVADIIAQVEALPLSDKAKENILYNNAARFYSELT